MAALKQHTDSAADSPANAAGNPHALAPTSLRSLFASFRRNRALIVRMTRREVTGRYKGSSIGLAWSLLNPIFMLAVYTIVFSEIFKSRWGGTGSTTNKGEFAVILFVGMIVLTLFSEVINRAPLLIVQNVNFVKKVIFPLEVLPIISVGAALFHSAVSLAVLVAAIVLITGTLHWTVVLLPFVLIPLVILVMGLAWVLSSLGVFLRDLSQTIALLTTVLMFLSPVFYPVSAVPAKFRVFIMANPLTFIIEQARAVLIWGQLPDWSGLTLYTIVAVLIAWAGYAWFQKTRKGFADVI